MVRKYLEPFREGVEHISQISTWINSKLEIVTWVDEVNGSLFCLARGHTKQVEMFYYHWIWAHDKTKRNLHLKKETQVS